MDPLTWLLPGPELCPGVGEGREVPCLPPLLPRSEGRVRELYGRSGVEIVRSRSACVAIELVLFHVKTLSPVLMLGDSGRHSMLKASPYASPSSGASIRTCGVILQTELISYLLSR
jgi:hypothetical protein